MAINLGTSFSVLTDLPIDNRLVMSKAEMLAANDNTMPQTYLTTCTDDGKLYIYNKSNTPNSETGKFEVSSGGDDSQIIEITKAEYDALTPAEKLNKTFLIVDEDTVENVTNMVSADSGNILKLGTDKGLYAPATTVTSTYSSSGTDAVNGKAVASAISGKANSSALGTQVTYTLSGTTLYINTK